MKVVLLVPDLARSPTFLQPPLCLCSIAANLPHTFSTRLIDNRVACLPLAELAAAIGVATDVVVVTTSPYDITQMYHFDHRLQYALRTIHYLRQHLAPQAKIIVIGPHASLYRGTLLDESGADIAVVGEVERTVPLLLETIAVRGELEGVPNVVFRNGGEWSASSRVEAFEHPDYSTFDDIPAWDLIDPRDYFGYELGRGGRYTRLDGWGVLLGSRGCPFSCTFCYNFWGGRLRLREVSSVLQEFEGLASRPGIRRLFFLDPTFTADRDWCLTLCSALSQASPSVPWICQTRCDRVDPELLGAMKRAGCVSIQYGVESFNDAILNATKKGSTAAHAERAVDMTTAAGIAPSCFLMVGLPGETEQTVAATIEFLRGRGLPFIPILYSPRHGSRDAAELFGENDTPHWNELLAWRGRRESSYPERQLIRDFGRLRGESFGTTAACFERDIDDTQFNHRLQFRAMRRTGSERDVEDCLECATDVVPFISVPLTKRCNLRCVYCGVGGEATICGSDRDFGLGDLMELLLICRQEGVAKVRLTGGEPFLHPDFDEIVRFLGDQGYYALVNTNGTLVAQHANALVRATRNLHVAVSLDTLRPDVFSKISRQPARLLDRSLAGVRLLKEAGVLMRINMVVTSENIHEVEEMIQFCVDLDCDLKLQEVASVPVPYSEWSNYHVSLDSTEAMLSAMADEQIVHGYASKLGVPVPIYRVGDIYVTLKSFSRGSRYDPGGICSGCQHFPCHEGLYDLFLLSDSSLSPCRWKIVSGVVDDFRGRYRETVASLRRAIHVPRQGLLSPLKALHHPTC
jgi:radical SAM superfamily enzyme YgiQ (UPF0313 family)/molybdenum cofactor biosynthesis enzyme MoaA